MSNERNAKTVGREETRKVDEREEVLEVVNTYFSIPVTSFTAIRMEQV